MPHSIAIRLAELNRLRRILSSQEPVHWSDVAALVRWVSLARRDPPAVRAQAKRLNDRKRLIFCLSSGRSGTGTLRKLFECLAGIDCLHEPQPNFVRYMRMSQLWPPAAYHFLVQAKLPAIAALSKPVYLETSHLVCKGFLEPIFELGLRPDLIVLHRPARQVARSIVRLDTAPGRTLTGLTWYLHPDDPGVLAYPGWRRASDYQLAFWYALEIERRQRYYAERAETLGCRVAYAGLDDLNDVPGVRRLWRKLDLVPNRDTLKRVNRIIGKRFNRKEDEGSPDSFADAALDAEEAAVVQATGQAPARHVAACRTPATV